MEDTTTRTQEMNCESEWHECECIRVGLYEDYLRAVCGSRVSSLNLNGAFVASAAMRHDTTRRDATRVDMTRHVT